MADIEDNLSSRNRDRFTQNLAVFRRDVNNFAKSGADGGGGALSPAHTPPNGHISPGLGLPNGNSLRGVGDGDGIDAIVAGFGHGGMGRGDMEA
jgi:hypothetical protein